MIPVLPLLSVAWTAVGKVLRAIPPWAWLVFAVLVAGYFYGEARADQRESEIRAEYELRSMKEAEQAQQLFAELEADHRKREDQLAYEIIQGEATHAKALRDAEARALATVDGLKSGAVQLRQHWQACLRKLPGPGQAPGAVAGNDDAADLRAADIGHLQRIGGNCDADVKRWQTTWEKAVQAVNAQTTGD